MVRSRQSAEGWILAAGVFVSVALGHTLVRLGPERLPQMPGENVLALVLGDARQQLSLALLDKVEEYFHGGVRNVVCDHGLGSAEGGREQGHDSERAKAAAGVGGFDPWSWLNARIHVQEDRHIEDRHAVELLPWVWAACRASPKNTEAFLTGSYVLARLAGRAEEGASLLRQGIANNPACAELDFSLGELYLGRLRDAARAEPCFLSALEKCAPAEGEAGDEARRLKIRALFYLGYLAKGRGDLERLRAYVREAEATDPEFVSTKDLRALLRSAEATGK